MRTRILIALLSILTLNTLAQEATFDKINNKTWFEDNGFAGTTIVFYKTSNGQLKAIRQINGAGVPVVSSEIFDVEIKHDTISLLNGLNLKTSERIYNLIYSFDDGTRQITELKMMLDKPILYSWTDKRRDIHTRIDMKLLSEIVIEKNEIYKEADLLKALIE